METTKTVQWEHDSRTSLVDVKLFKMIGLYKLLRPSDGCRGGRFGDRYRKTILTVLLLMTGLQCMQIVRLYSTIHELQMFLYVMMISSNVLICMFKMYVMITNVDGLWSVLDAARYRFTACSFRDTERLRRYQEILSTWLRMFVVLSSVTLVLWVVAPLFINEYVPFTKMDGTVGHYRTSIFNLWFPVTEHTYNWTPFWALIYTFESCHCFTDVLCWLLFDCYFVTMCIVLTAHFDIMCAAYETLGSRQPSLSSSIRIEIQGMELEHYNDLILHIQDNTKITKKFDEFFDLIRPVVFVQIIVGSISMISLIFCAILAYKSSVSILSVPIMKFLSAYASFTIQLFIYCYSLNRVETAKSSLNFGLYSSNWTEMSLKFRKTLLLAMNINSAHIRVIRVSPNLVVNLEMFARLMKTSFSIVSVLLNII